MNDFLKEYELLNITFSELENINISIIMETNKENYQETAPHKSQSGIACFTGDFYQTFSNSSNF